jgi:hypothetical protein
LISQNGGPEINISRSKPVTVVDPDLPRRTLVDAWDQGTDKKTGERLVVLTDEPLAVRRVPADHVFTGPRLVARKPS